MAWSRTLLTIAILAALLVRDVVVSDASPAVAAVVATIALLMIGLGLARLRQLAKRGPAAGERPPRRTLRWEFAGLIALAALGVVFALT